MSPYLIAFYIAFNFVSNWEIKSWYFFLFPFYALFQVLILPWCGIYRYIKTVSHTGNWGRITINLKRNLQWYQHLKHWSTTFVIAFMVLVTVSTTVQIYIFSRPMEPADIIYIVWKNKSKAVDSVKNQFTNIANAMTAQIYITNERR